MSEGGKKQSATKRKKETARCRRCSRLFTRFPSVFEIDCDSRDAYLAPPGGGELLAAAHGFEIDGMRTRERNEREQSMSTDG